MTTDEEAVKVASRVATAFVEDLMLTGVTRAYGRYFRSEWLKKTAQWAVALRSRAFITTNNALESWHSQLNRRFPRLNNRTAQDAALLHAGAQELPACQDRVSHRVPSLQHEVERRQNR